MSSSSQTAPDAANPDLAVRTSDGVDLTLGAGVLPHLHTLATLAGMMRDGAVGPQAGGAPTPLPAVTGDQLRLVCDFYTGAPIDWRKQDLHALLTVADYLDAPALCDEAAHQIALSVMGKSSAEMRAILGMPDDLTPEEKAALAAEFDWKAGGEQQTK